jgi:acyl transferase domain-containing protein
VYLNKYQLTVNRNGRTAGISHPSADGQEALIRRAYKAAKLTTRDTAYFECHGTGTPVGDPVEISAISKVFGAERVGKPPLLIGSVKTNLGHSEAVSGLVGIMKTILAMEKGFIPATIGVRELNPNSE